jgi:hypothetical protein
MPWLLATRNEFLVACNKQVLWKRATHLGECLSDFVVRKQWAVCECSLLSCKALVAELLMYLL